MSDTNATNANATTTTNGTTPQENADMSDTTTTTTAPEGNRKQRRAAAKGQPKAAKAKAAKPATAPAPNDGNTLAERAASKIITDAINASNKGQDQAERARGEMAYGITLMVRECAMLKRCADMDKLAPLNSDEQTDKKTTAEVLKMVRQRIGLEVSKTEMDAQQWSKERRDAYRAKTMMVQRGYELARAIHRLNMVTFKQDNEASTIVINFDDKARVWNVPLFRIAPAFKPTKADDAAGANVAKAVAVKGHIGRTIRPVRRASYWLPIVQDGEPVKIDITYDRILKAAGKGTNGSTTRTRDAAALVAGVKALTEADGPVEALGNADDEGTTAHALCQYVVNHYSTTIAAMMERRNGATPAVAKAAAQRPARKVSNATHQRQRG